MRRARVYTVFLVMLGSMLAPAGAQAGDARTSVIESVNQIRASNGLNRLRPSPSLSRTSSSFSSHMMKQGAFGHRPRVSASNRFKTLGEALAMHFGHKPRAGATVRRWMNSLGHRAVILKPGVSWVGAGYHRGRFRGRRATIWVLQVGK